MIASIARFSVISVLVLLVAAAALAQQTPPDISELAGNYYTGHDYGGASLTLEQNGRYTIDSHDCTSSRSETGTYVFSSGVLRFKTEKRILKGDSDPNGVDLLDPEERTRVFGSDSGEITTEFQLLLIRWSGRTYLIPEEDLGNFANAINFGLEPRSRSSSERYYGAFYLRDGDEKKKVQGPPQLPGNWQAFLLRRPVRARIVALEAQPNGTIVTINKGSQNGLRVGMRMVARDEEPSLWSNAEIVSVKARTAKLRTAGGVSVGDALTTKYVTRFFSRN